MKNPIFTPFLILLAILLLLSGCGVQNEPSALSSGDSGQLSATNTPEPSTPASGPGSIIIRVETMPADMAAPFTFSGQPRGSLSGEETLVLSNLDAGSYSSSQADPGPDFIVTAVSCDDGESATPSQGSAASRTAVFNLDPGEIVTCTFINSRPATAELAIETDPAADDITFTFRGDPDGSASSSSALTADTLPPGSYTAELEANPDYELTAVTCDDQESSAPSSGDPATGIISFELEPDETTRCLLTLERINVETAMDVENVTTTEETGRDASSSDADTSSNPDSDSASDNSGSGGGSGINPFTSDSIDFENFPLPAELPADAGNYDVPVPGTWSTITLAGVMNCGITALDLPATPAEPALLEFLDDGATILVTGLSAETGEAITMRADPAIRGRYTGEYDATMEGVAVTFDYVWQLITDEYIVGYFDTTLSSDGVTCTMIRPFELTLQSE